MSEFHFSPLNMPRRPLQSLCLAILAFTVLGGCQDRPEVTSPGVVVSPPAGPGMTLSADLIPGATGRVLGLFHAPRGFPAIGSFAVRVTYDTSRLAFLGDASPGSGMRVMQEKEGVLSIAGASTDGFGSDTMFVANFRVVGANASGSLMMDIVEMHGARFENVLSTLDARGSIRAHQAERPLR